MLFRSLFYGVLFIFCVFVSISLLEAQSIDCRSCENNFCSQTTKIGLISQGEVETRNYNLQVTFFCSGCTRYTLRVAFDDSFKKTYIVEKSGQDGLQDVLLSLKDFYISDGMVSITFELASTGPSGFSVADSFSCQVIYDDYPKEPSGVSAFGKDRSFTVQWGRPQDRDIAKFMVFVGFPDSCSSYVFETQADTIEISKLGDEPVQNGVRYCGYVVAVDNGGKISPPSDKFYVVPATSFELSRYGPVDENIGCIISHIFGKDSKITRDIRKFRNFVSENIPYGYLIVSAYYSFSNAILRFINLIKDLVKWSGFAGEAYAQTIQNEFKRSSDYIFSLGVGGAQFNKLGNFQGVNTFQLIYGKTTFFGDIEFGRVILRLLRNEFSLFLIGRANFSYLQGKRLIFDDQGNLQIVPESYSNFLFFPVWIGLNLFGEFIDYQIFVPSFEVLLGGNFFIESYRVGRSIFGAVFGGTFAISGNLLLNDFDKRSEAIVRAEYGIEKSYLFIKISHSTANFVRVKGHDFKLKRSSYFDFSATSISLGVSLLF